MYKLSHDVHFGTTDTISAFSTHTILHISISGKINCFFLQVVISDQRRAIPDVQYTLQFKQNDQVRDSLSSPWTKQFKAGCEMLVFYVSLFIFLCLKTSKQLLKMINTIKKDSAVSYHQEVHQFKSYKGHKQISHSNLTSVTSSESEIDHLTINY